jgi:outer membrane immunogenic protein
MRRLGHAAAILLIAAGLGGTASADGPYVRPAGHRPADVPVYFYDWTGIYVGGLVGGAYTRTEWEYLPDSPQHTFSSFAGGAMVGLQKQWSNAVFGVEAAYVWSDWERTSASIPVPDLSLTSDVSNLLLVTGKVGHAWQNALAFAKAGYATADVDFATSRTSTGAILTTSSAREHGWTAGLGIDYAVLPNIVIGLEYDYVRLNAGGRTQLATPAGPAGTSVSDAGVDIQMVMGRLSFKFGPRPAEPFVK